jgi:hypothetical protein
MIPVEEALARIFALCPRLPAETVPLAQAAGRVLAEPVQARRDQPPFAASAMDGYAVAGDAAPGARFRVIGEAGAGHAFDRELGPEEAVRIFTGAPVPEGATRVVIQEDVTRDGDTITLKRHPGRGRPYPARRRRFPHRRRALRPAPVAPCGPRAPRRDEPAPGHRQPPPRRRHHRDRRRAGHAGR